MMFTGRISNKRLHIPNILKMATKGIEVADIELSHLEAARRLKSSKHTKENVMPIVRGTRINAEEKGFGSYP